MAPVTQTITVLFTDLVGSTELFSSLSPQEADDLRNDHFSLLRGAVSGAGGLEVKSLGDGLMVAFSSLSRALACAVAMQQAVERRNRRSPNALAIRVGLSTGGRAAKLSPSRPRASAISFCTKRSSGCPDTRRTTRPPASRK